MFRGKIFDKGKPGYMQYFNGLIGCGFIILALLHTAEMSHTCWISYSSAALLAFISLKSNIHLATSRILAGVTTLLMFFYFASFFTVAPGLEDEWYRENKFWEAISQIMAAFCLIPVLSNYTCRLKTEFHIPHHLN
ncbi:MAG: hypothetical protein O7E57_07455 [Gammaproteobacteria bacterium]|nr:hypothetical protein [Gammaproteobacteria bacterium]